MLRLGIARGSATALSSNSGICQICTAVISRRSHHQLQPFGSERRLTTRTAIPSSTTTGRRRDVLSPAGHPKDTAAWFHSPRGTTAVRVRATFSSTATSLRDERHGQSLKIRQGVAEPHRGSASSADVREPKSVPLEKIVAPVQQVKKLFLAQGGIPTEQSILAALKTCESAAGLLKDVKVPPQLSALEPKTGTAASSLLSMETSRHSDAGAATGAGVEQDTAPASSQHPHRGKKPVPHSAQGPSQSRRSSEPERSPVSSHGQIDQVIDSISEAAHTIVTHPAVSITPQVLARYVAIHSRLGRPESLPEVLALFASKPVPRAATNGIINYVEQKPHRRSGAVEAGIAEAALSVAIEARNMDAAVAIIEATYGTKAFARSKFMRRAVPQLSLAVLFPGMVYALATGISTFVNTMDDSSATGIAFAAILTYLGFTGLMGVIAAGTVDDQMKRVTWTPGTSLATRWIREEERAAYDRVATSFGFSEAHRYGEEQGREFLILREFLLHKSMILDRVEFMAGMESSS